jgi:hypothetical protein
MFFFSFSRSIDADNFSHASRKIVGINAVKADERDAAWIFAILFTAQINVGENGGCSSIFSIFFKWNADDFIRDLASASGSEPVERPMIFFVRTLVITSLPGSIGSDEK